MYMGIVAHSQILATPLIVELKILDVLCGARDALAPQQLCDDTLADVILALKAAIVSFQQQASSHLKLGTLVRLRAEDADTQGLLQKLEDHLDETRSVP
jgi:hypothetical protein